jgi:hypothetical protein
VAANFALAPKASGRPWKRFPGKDARSGWCGVDLSKFAARLWWSISGRRGAAPASKMPELTAHGEYAPRNVEFVGIGIDSASNIQDF